ncbi:MAG: ABC transporter permease subunit, partial [Betaproteobacteria bacterium]
MSSELLLADPIAPATRPSVLSKVAGNWSVRIGAAVLVLLVVVALAAPWMGTVDPGVMDGAIMNVLPGLRGEFTLLDGTTVKHTFWMGADSFGRDIWSRVLYGTRISLTVGLFVAVVALSLGGLSGLSAGYLRWLDGVLMRIMDGLMAIPGILLAIALVAAWGASLTTVVVAIAIPEIPRTTRLVRSLVLSIREEPYVEAAVALGTPTWKIMLRHILPNAIAPLIVQGTFTCGSAILLESILSFLGVGPHAAAPAASKCVLDIVDLGVSLPSGADRAFAVRNISFSVNAGEIVCLLGESGSGKSIIAQTVMGLLPSNIRATEGSA